MVLSTGNSGTSIQSKVAYRQLNPSRRTLWRCGATLISLVVVGVIVTIAFIASNRTSKGPPSPPQLSNPGFHTPACTRDQHCKGRSKPETSPPEHTKRPGIPDYVCKMSRMKSDSHPCDDFYRYACGHWMDRHPADGLDLHSPIESMQEDIQNILSGLLGRPSSIQEPQAVQKVKRLYRSCMDKSSIKGQASDPLANILADVNIHNDVIDMLVAMAKYNSYPLGVVSVTKDAKNTTRNVILLNKPKFPVQNLSPRNRVYTGYKDFIDKVVSQLNSDENGRGDQVVSDVFSLLSFQQGLTQLTEAKDSLGTDEWYHMYTFGSLNRHFPQFDWKRYISGVFSQYHVNITLKEDQPVLVTDAYYFKKIGRYLKRSHMYALKDYMRWILVHGYLPYLPDRFRTASRIFLKAIGYEIKAEPRWKICTSFMDTLLFNITGRLFLEEEFDPEAMTVTKEMVQDIRKAFKERMQADSWMDRKTKQRAIEKLDAIRELIGYPPDIMNDTLLDQQFEDLTITDQFFENVVAVIKRQQWSTLRSLQQPAIREEWIVGPTTVNAFYKPENNIIIIPAGVLRKPIFSPEYPKSVIYSSLGFLVAHEMTHGFDNTGSKFDKEGNLIDWWSDTAMDAYKQKETCYSIQYSLYSIDDAEHYTLLDGYKTLGENIADNGGIRDAFKAYTEWVSRQTKVSTLPYLGLTNNQVFYLAFAQLWCETRGSQMASFLAKASVHSPGALRVKGTLQNSDHFAQTFNCKPGTVMNPTGQKCRIW